MAQRGALLIVLLILFPAAGVMQRNAGGMPQVRNRPRVNEGLHCDGEVTMHVLKAGSDAFRLADVADRSVRSTYKGSAN